LGLTKYSVCCNLATSLPSPFAMGAWSFFEETCYESSKNHYVCDQEVSAFDCCWWHICQPCPCCHCPPLLLAHCCYVVLLVASFHPHYFHILLDLYCSINTTSTTTSTICIIATTCYESTSPTPCTMCTVLHCPCLPLQKRTCSDHHKLNDSMCES